MTTLKIGGPLARSCGTCHVDPGAGCVLLSGPDGRPVPWPRRRPHAARVKAAPPEVDIAEGAFVIVRWRDAEWLALLENLPAAVCYPGHPVGLRLWDPFYGFGPHVRFKGSAVLRLASENAQTAAMRATLAAEGRAA